VNGAEQHVYIIAQLKFTHRELYDRLSLPETQIWLTASCESADNRSNERSLRLIWCAMVGLVRSRAALQAEILILRHQLNVLWRKSPKRVAVGTIDRPLFCRALSLLPQGAPRTQNPQARDGPGLASLRRACWTPRALPACCAAARLDDQCYPSPQNGSSVKRHAFHCPLGPPWAGLLCREDQR
jgi:hypothetical protein